MSSIRTLRDLKASGWRSRSVKEELRANLRAMLAEGKDPFPGIHGYEKTVLPALHNAILSRHDLLLLGLRGQAKTRLLRMLVNLLDAEIPAVEGSPLNDDPFRPVSKHARRVLAERGDDTPIVWIPRSERYREKLATPDVTIADLIGDIDPIKAATERRSYSDEEVIHYGIVPRTNRGIFAINELPDLQPRIQVGLLNILEERDLQIRGFPVRLPLDLLFAFSANPEDYTNRGTIITPLKDRIDSQIMTHYPADLEEAMAITNQEAWTERDTGADLRIPEYFREIVEEIAFEARDSEYVDQNSGVSARLAITALENVMSNMERRAITTGDNPVHARISDLQAAVPALTGKIELVYEGEQEGPIKVAKYLIGKAVKEIFESYFPGAHRGKSKEREDVATSPYKAVVEWFSSGKKLEIGDEEPADAYFRTLDSVKGLREVAKAFLKTDDPASLGPVMELVLEGLHQSAILAKEEVEGQVTYLDMFQTMFSNLEQKNR
jgi:magnesium chelatase subunit I